MGEFSDISEFGRCKSANSWSLQPGVDASDTLIALGPWSSHGLEVRVMVALAAGAGVEVAKRDVSLLLSLKFSFLTNLSIEALVQGLTGLAKSYRQACSPIF